MTPFFPDQPLVVRLRLLELRGLESFVADASHWNDKDWEGFAALLEHAVARNGVRQTDLSDELGVSQGTVSRWMRRRSHPHPAVARMVVGWIVANVESRAGTLRRSLEADHPNLSIPDWTAGRRRDATSTAAAAAPAPAVHP